MLKKLVSLRVREQFTGYFLDDMAPGRGGGVGHLNSDGVQRLLFFISVLVSYVHVRLRWPIDTKQ
jgi:hypothetical protein